MRFRAIFAAMLVLLTSVLGVCPACDRAHLADSASPSMSQSAHEHACCDHTQASESGLHPKSAPDSKVPTDGCAHETASLMLEAASPHNAVAHSVLADVPFAHTVVAEFVPVAAAAEWHAAIDPDPPPLHALPIRI